MNRTLQLRWDLSAAEVTALTADIVARYGKLIDGICNLPAAQISPATVLRPWAHMDGDAATLSVQCTLPAFCSSQDPAVREASSAAKQTLKRFWSELFQRTDLYQVCKAIQPDDPELAPDERRLLTHLQRDFERNGCLLQGATKDRFKALRAQEAQLCSEFEQNVNEDTSFVSLSEDALEGVPKALLAAMQKGDAGELRVGLKYPECFPILQYCTVAETRRIIDTARQQRCLSNADRLESLANIRHEAAQILGFPNHAEFMLQNKMAGSADAVNGFISGIVDKLLPQAVEDKKSLIEAKNKLAGTKESDIAPWDVRFYSRLQREELFELNEAEVAKYFPLPHVLSEIMRIYSEILNLRFEKLDDTVWHPDVEFYAVQDGTTDQLLGHFFLDLFPRDGKFGHQCVLPIRPSYERADGSRQTPVAALVGNNPKPVPGQPSLLKHEMVKTLFHEFGHVIHCVCTDVRHSRFSWAWSAVPYPGGVEYDFLEVPSMMLENWVWEKAVLKRLSSHVEDSERTLPDDIIERLKAMKDHHMAWLECRYFALASFDMLMHSGPEARAGRSLRTIYAEFYRDVGLLETIDDTNFLCTFYHMVQGYDAGYYGYAWSEAYGKDMYSEFEKSNEGCFDKDLGKKLRDTVLTPGASKDGVQMLRAFLGRDPSTEAFLRSLHIC